MLPNFKSSVPESLQNKIKDFIDNASFDNIILCSAKFGALSEERTEDIEGNYVSGWMPKQDGGFELNQFYQSDIDSSYHFTEKQTEFNNEQHDNCYKSFLSDNDIESDVQWEELTEEQKEGLNEYEREWFSDDALLQLQIYCNGYTEWKNEEKTVVIRLSINYKDTSYFREGSAEDIKEIILDIDEFMSTSNEELLKQFTV